MDHAACAAGVFCTIREVNRRLLPQMAVPRLKLACNAWHFGPMGAAVDRVYTFCGDPPVDSLTHFVACQALFNTTSEVSPGSLGPRLPR